MPSAYAVSGAPTCAQWFNSQIANNTVTSSARTVGPTLGWIPINLANISSGAPIGQWPADPAWSLGTNAAAGNANAGHFYSYIATSSNNGYKLAAKMESTLYSQGGTGDLESTDGGVDNEMYEQGTLLTL
jgi:hypothetical protein